MTGALVGEVQVSSAGSYAVGAATAGADGPIAVGSDLATLSYAAEYLPGRANESLLAALSEVGGGRGAITPDQAFDGQGLPAAPRRIPLAGWLLTAAVAVWLAALVLGRLWIAGTAPRPVPVGGRAERRGPTRPAGPSAPAGDTGSAGSAGPADQPVDRPAPAPPPDPEAPQPQPTTMEELLRAKRDRG